MLDLLIKKVIRTEDVPVRSHESSPERILTYVQAGINFQSYQPKAHEVIFLSIFKTNLDIKFLFKHLVKGSIEKSKSKHNLVFNQILSSSEISSLFNTLKVVGFISLNDSGRKAKIQLQTDLRKLKSSLRHDPSLLMKVYGNLFLDPDILKNNDQKFVRDSYNYYSIYSGNFDHSFRYAESHYSGGWFGDWGSDSLTG